MTNNLGKAEREAIVSKVMTTVEMKHYDPHFAKDRWRTLVEERRAEIVASGNSADFESSIADLVRSVGTPDSGFFHESTRKKVPKGLAARFQYCQPNECAPAYTQPSDAGDVFLLGALNHSLSCTTSRWVPFASTATSSSFTTPSAEFTSRSL